MKCQPGAPPFMFENEYELQSAHMQMVPPPLAGRVRDLSPQAEAAIMQALAKRPEDRFATVDDFGRALGIAGVAGNSVEILQQLVGSVFRNTPSAATRLISSGPRRDPPSYDEADTRRRGLADVGTPGSWAVPGLAAIPKAFRGPAALLGGAVVVVGIGLSYLYFSAPGPGPIREAIVAHTTPGPQSPVTIAPKETSPVFFSAPGASSAPGSAPSLPSNEPPVVKSPLVPAPIPLPPTPAPSQPLPLPGPVASLETPARGVPDISGSFQDLDDASVFISNGKKFQLFGVNDPIPPTRQHRAAVLAVVHSILDGKQMLCYRKEPLQYQCFVNGEEDLALLLLHRGLVVLRSDAPQAYR